MAEHNSTLRNNNINDNKVFDKININLRKTLVKFMILTILALGFTGYKINEINTRAFTVKLGEEKIGIVRNEEEALKIMEGIREDISNTYGAEGVLDKELTFETVHVKDELITHKSDLKKNIESRIDFLVSGITIRINGEDMGFVKSEQEAKSIIDEIKSPFMESIEGKVKEVKILEDVLMVKSQSPINMVSDHDELVEFIRLGGEEIKTHTVEVGESFWTIAMMYHTSVEELIEANKDLNPNKLKPGDEVRLLVPTSKLTVQVVEEVEFNRAVDFETIVETSDSMYTNQSKVKVEGIKGESHIVENRVKENGIIVDKEVVSEEVIKEPVNQILVKGTKEVPKTAATGVFMMPTRGRFTSGYGQRWGRMHRGIDIAASVGTPIYAADGGTVTHSGWQGTYGYMVEITHGNGYVTRYAHASKLLVSKGTKVYKGQHIANVGNTGRSTGPHLHLEVLKNGAYVNPSKYVK